MSKVLILQIMATAIVTLLLSITVIGLSPKGWPQSGSLVALVAACLVLLVLVGSLFTIIGSVFAFIWSF